MPQTSRRTQLPPLSAARARDLIGRFAGALILVVGDVMLDEFIWGDVQRISPEAPVPIVELRQRSYVPGGAGNTAANIASLGGRVRLGGVVGADVGARQLGEALFSAGVEGTGLLVDPDDRENLVRSLARLLRDAGAARRMGWAGRERWERELGIDRFRQRLAPLLARLVAG